MDEQAKKRRGRRYGGAMMLWMMFAGLFDPPKAAAMEHIQKQARLGAEADRDAATPAAPPGDPD
jgi:hypothetical protein